MPIALIVEDEPEANKLLAALVQLRGFQTISVFNGQDALNYLDSGRPDAVFLDLMLPDKNGYDICRSMKSHPATCLVPVIIVTARLAAENRLKSFRVGAQAYVPKPYTPAQIFAALDHALNWRRELDQNPGRGVIRFGSGDGEERLHEDLTRLRCLLRARTPLGETATVQVVETVRTIGDDARSWGRDRDLGHIATAHYEVHPDRLVLTIRDESGWFAAGDLTEAAAGFDPPLNQVFDQVTTADSGSETILVKTFPAIDQATDC